MHDQLPEGDEVARKAAEEALQLAAIKREEDFLNPMVVLMDDFFSLKPNAPKKSKAEGKRGKKKNVGEGEKQEAKSLKKWSYIPRSLNKSVGRNRRKGGFNTAPDDEFGVLAVTILFFSCWFDTVRPAKNQGQMIVSTAMFESVREFVSRNYLGSLDESGLSSAVAIIRGEKSDGTLFSKLPEDILSLGSSFNCVSPITVGPTVIFESRS